MANPGCSLTREDDMIRDKYDADAPSVKDFIRCERDNEALVAWKVEGIVYDDWQWVPEWQKVYYTARAWGWRESYALRWGYWLFRFQGKFNLWKGHQG
jgi:hypothetical protein